ncbi:MAG: hypothetical protein D6751_05710 [Deltaproteobacteria bacterium]|nr:MAG: hypothetical protein D6751_05710 [Deltaproteobacteria bacterium]
MEIISDLLIGGGAIGAASYCFILARRLRRLGTLEDGVGGAVAVLSLEVDQMTRTLDAARKAAGESSEVLTEMTDRAEAAARKLELLIASLHDLPNADPVAGEENDSEESEQDDEWVAAENAQDSPPEAQPMFSSHRLAQGGRA